MSAPPRFPDYDVTIVDGTPGAPPPPGEPLVPPGYRLARLTTDTAPDGRLPAPGEWEPARPPAFDVTAVPR